MKRIFFLTMAIVMLQGHNVQAQKSLSNDYSYTVSEPYQVYDSPRKKYFSDGETILAVKPWKKKVIVQKYDVGSLTNISAETYEDFPDNAQIEGMIQLQDKFYFFFSSWTGRKTKHEQLFVREIDYASGTFKGEAKRVIDIDGRLAGTFASTAGVSTPFSFGSVGVTDKFDFFTSADESKLLIQYRRKPTEKNDKKSYSILGAEVFDTDLNKLWGQEYKMPYTERKMDFVDFAVDASGTGYLLAKIFLDDSGRDKKKKKDEKANYYMELLIMRADTDALESKKIDLENKFINGISLFESFDGTLICAGFYAAGNKRDLNDADGLFTIAITQSGTIENLKTYEIPVALINQFEKNKTKRKNNKKEEKGEAEFENLRLTEIRFFEDGSLLLVGEQFFKIYHRTKNSGYFTYHYEDILVSRIDVSGNLKWMKKIPKSQMGKPSIGQVYDTSSTYVGGMSYTYMYTNNSHYIIFLDNVKNFGLELDERPARHTDGKGGFLTAVKINDDTGVTTKGSILDTREVKEDLEVYQFNTDRIVQTAENEFVVEVYKKKKEDVMIKVKIK
ncbi:hypothetical protein [Dokdonia sp.]|uniref:hypothetical protein n=1 Tax=Dokdonia sp. TaxID=2024995 RepID=UPI003263F240